MKSKNAFFGVVVIGLGLLACSPKPDSAEAATGAATGAVAEAAEQAPALSAVAQREDPVFVAGKAVYNRMCVACHQSHGKGLPPAFPSIANSAVVTGDLDGQINLILNGVSGTAMVAFGPQLSDDDIAAVITYQRNAFGNDTGDVVTPEQVAALR